MTAAAQPSPAGDSFTIGVEEEYQIVDPQTRLLRPRVKQVLHQAEDTLGDQVQTEFHASQIEIATPVCRTLADVRAQLIRSRRAVIEAASRDGDRIVAAGTHPISPSEQQPITPKDRYLDMAQDYQHLARELVIFGCHVHVSVDDGERAIGVMNRARLWLAPLLALTASSPFWSGQDTGYASFRTEMWIRWPMAGPPLLFASRAEHDRLVQALAASGAISDATKIYWDIRLPQHLPTVEFRVADVCPTIDEAVLLAGLVRALVRTSEQQARQNAPFAPVRPELLRAAHWRAARYGLDGDLIDVVAERSVPAGVLVNKLLALTRPVLEEAGEWDEVSGLVERVLRNGSSASRQRAVFERTGRMEEVVDRLIEETAHGVV